MTHGAFLRDKMVKARLLHHEVHMTWPVAMPLQHFQQLPNWPIIRNRIRHWHDCFEPEHSFLIAMHHSSLIRLLAAFVLHIVLSITVRFPDVDFHSFYWLSFCVFDGADDETWLALGVVCDLGAVGFGDGVVGVEWSEDSAFGT
jgi:hypothetical protein